MATEVKRLDATTTNDFYALHGKAPFEWCHCVAWEVPVWEGWNERTAVENLVLRESIFTAGRFEGYLLYVDGRPVGWCQCGPRDSWPKLARQYALPPSPNTYAVTCFCILPEFRRQGYAHALLDAVLADLRRRGVGRVEAFPRPGQHQDHEVWTGPIGLFLRSGFRIEREDPQRPVLALHLQPTGRLT